MLSRARKVDASSPLLIPYSYPPSQVESLTLRADRQTSHRRVPAVPQLKCVSSKGICSKYKIDVLRCENKGSGYDSEDIQWSCTASLPPELKLGSTDVVRVNPFSYGQR